MNYYIFKTNIYKEKAVHMIGNLLKHYFRIEEIGFEVDNKKSYLSVKASNTAPSEIQAAINNFGYRCSEVIDR